MTSAWEYFGKISSFGDSGLALTATLTANLAFTGIHIWEEAKGAKAPLYRAFGGIVGVCLPRPVGIAVFTVLLALVQWTAGLAAYAGWPPFLGSDSWQVSITALGFVLGARIADSVISHWRLLSGRISSQSWNSFNRSLHFGGRSHPVDVPAWPP